MPQQHRLAEALHCRGIKLIFVVSFTTATKHLMVYKCAMVSIPIYVLSLYLVEVMSFPVPNITILK